MTEIRSVLVACLFWFFSSFLPAFAGEVGVVQLLIGEAQLLRGAEQSALLQGQILQEGDVVTTFDRALVQIKTYDEAFLSLRANTQMQIECYQSHCMKLNLNRGEMRQVTGKQGQANKESYRLNTPVAAIGVRGTDFITRATNDDTWVRVLQGAVVAAPFDESCMRSMLGVCTSHHAALLAAQDPFVLHLQPNSAPVAIPGDAGLQARATPSSAAPTVAVRSVGDDVFTVLRDHPEVVQRYLALAQANVMQNNLPGSVPPSSVSPLVFATWLNQSDGIAQGYTQASQGREVTVGDNQYALWRSAGVYTPQQGVVNYTLSASQANIVNNDGQLSGATIDQAALRINFDARQLSTQLRVVPTDHAPALAVSASGYMVRDDGIFALNTDQGGRIAGALSNNTQQAGYLLNQPMANGNLKALTTWQAQ